MPIIRLETIILAPIQGCFDLSRNIDVHKESVSHTKEKAIAGVTSGLIDLHQTVTWEAVHFGLKLQLTSKITEYDSPHYFVDEMVEGPFKQFRHEHQFMEYHSGTKMIDSFDFTSPLGILGKAAEQLFLLKYMKKLLIARNQYIKHIAETKQKQSN